jgi:hypothetical protein
MHKKNSAIFLMSCMHACFFQVIQENFSASTILILLNPVGDMTVMIIIVAN